jgi:hypothetical protein
MITAAKTYADPTVALSVRKESTKTVTSNER